MSITDEVLAAPRIAPTGRTSVSVSLRGPQEAVLTVAGEVGPVAARLVEVVLDTVLVDGVRHVIADLSAVREPSRPLGDALASVSSVLERRGGWLLVEGGAESGWFDVGGVESPTSLLDAFRAYRSAVER
ncbi:hypothetical protein [Pseudonocardia humida]|uniref:STAS domain-containing protein n=1 Tax=Pseudonocardia humida TaxID=2800819 RepID=A0ABT0ZTP6_9PSEU|nr:hypothetical protein [Pseudonocardia humida]MCO1654063.1 hypothetical protein [Pseudonocardia humida]